MEPYSIILGCSFSWNKAGVRSATDSVITSYSGEAEEDDMEALVSARTQGYFQLFYFFLNAVEKRLILILYPSHLFKCQTALKSMYE